MAQPIRSAAMAAPTPGAVTIAPQRTERRLRRVIEMVLATLAVEVDELEGVGRRPAVVLARGLISYVARRCTPCSFPEIARAIGRPTHTTVLAAAQRVQRQVDNEDLVDLHGEVIPMRELVQRIEKLVNAGAGRP